MSNYFRFAPKSGCKRAGIQGNARRILMATYEASVKKAVTASQQDLIDHKEHCSVDPVKLATVGRKRGHQVRVKRTTLSTDYTRLARSARKGRTISFAWALLAGSGSGPATNSSVRLIPRCDSRPSTTPKPKPTTSSSKGWTVPAPSPACGSPDARARSAAP